MLARPSRVYILSIQRNTSGQPCGAVLGTYRFHQIEKFGCRPITVSLKSSNPLQCMPAIVRTKPQLTKFMNKSQNLDCILSQLILFLIVNLASYCAERHKYHDQIISISVNSIHVKPSSRVLRFDYIPSRRCINEMNYEPVLTKYYSGYVCISPTIYAPDLYVAKVLARWQCTSTVPNY